MNEIDLADLDRWAIYNAPSDCLPTSPGRMLVTQAIHEITRRTRAARAHESTDGVPPRDDGWHRDRDRTAARVAQMLRSRSMSSVARRVGGGTPFPLGRAHWDHDNQLDVAATGVMRIETAAGRWEAHWVFVEDDEVELVASIVGKVERPNSPYVNPEYQWRMRMEEISALLLSNVKALVRRDDGHREERSQAAMPNPAISQLTALC